MMLEEIAFFLGRAICHQLPERTFSIDGHYLPICARDTGIYIGIFSSLLYLYLTKKQRANMIPNRKISFILFIFLFPLAFDGFGSYLHVYETNNLLRLVTGILFGMSFPFFIMPLHHYKVGEKSRRPSLTKVRELLIPFTLAAGIGTLVYHSMIPFAILDALIPMTLIYWVSLLFFLFFKRFKKRSISISLSICSSIFALILLSYLHLSVLL